MKAVPLQYGLLFVLIRNILVHWVCMIFIKIIMMLRSFDNNLPLVSIFLIRSILFECLSTRRSASRMISLRFKEVWKRKRSVLVTSQKLLIGGNLTIKGPANILQVLVVTKVVVHFYLPILNLTLLAST